ncbi:MAG: hypothetical protein CAF41_006650 [Nitrospira sp. CG24A]|nr:MAG: hypothetical protein CAF41_006650 [Nitrospira sp. CG24A]
MKWLITLSLILYAFAVPLQPVQADSSTAPNFGPLASLVGEWQGKDPEGKPMTASYQWTGSGTTLVETMTKAQKPMMMTMYHAHKTGLMLTHYCKLGNQPRMRADLPGSDAKTLSFHFIDITNLANPTDAHMHKVSFTFQDQDHFTQEWILSKDGKELPHRFEYTRAK